MAMSRADVGFSQVSVRKTMSSARVAMRPHNSVECLHSEHVLRRTHASWWFCSGGACGAGWGWLVGWCVAVSAGEMSYSGAWVGAVAV